MVPWVAGNAKMRGFAGRTHGKLVHIDFTQSHHAFVAQVLHHVCGIRCDKVFQHF